MSKKIRLAIRSSKRITPKPYAAKLFGSQKVWATKNKLTNTQISFTFDDGIQVGDVIEWRVSIWDGDDYTNPRVRWGLVTKDDFILLSRNMAFKAAVARESGDVWVQVTGSDYSGDLSGGLTEEEEARFREESGGDFIAIRKQSGELFLPRADDEQELLDGTIQGQAWRLPTISVEGIKAADNADLQAQIESIKEEMQTATRRELLELGKELKELQAQLNEQS